MKYLTRFKMDQINSRRTFLKEGISRLMLIGGGLALLAGCVSKSSDAGNKNPADMSNPCDDSVLGKDDLKARESMGYVKKSPVASKQCGNCKLFLPVPGTKACGRCQLFKGPVDATGNCAYWAPQT